MPADHPAYRRLWRLSILLTGGDLAQASRVFSAARRIERKPESLSPLELDKICLLGSRSIKRSQVRSGSEMKGLSDTTAKVLLAASTLPQQPLEAWILTRLDELDEIHVARAMDCSKTATARHLAAADAALAPVFSAIDATNPASALGRIRADLDAIDAAPQIQRMIAASAKPVRIKAALVLALLAAAALVGLYFGLRPLVGP